MSLNDIQVTALSERFEARAKALASEADGCSASPGEAAKLTGMAGSLVWAARELRLCAGLDWRGPEPVGIDLSRLYRAVVEPADWRTPARHAFVDASNHNVAVKKLAAAIGGLEYRSPAALADGRIYNVSSTQELIDEGMGSDELRIFETGWNGHAPTYVKQPLFLVDEPAPLILLWCRCPQEVAP